MLLELNSPVDGAKFFYENPLASAGQHHRQEWFECPCCPPNVARLLASLGGYLYSTGQSDIWVHLYTGSEVNLRVDGRPVTLRQVTRYPWEGKVRFEVGVQTPQTFTLHLRVPAWCEEWSLRVNGTKIKLQPKENGYLSVQREWQPGDVVEYEMHTLIQAVWANPAVRQLEGRIALQRGPLVYCLEGADHGGVILDRLAVRPDDVLSGKFSADYQAELLGGVTTLRGPGSILEAEGWGETLYRSRPPASRQVEITAVPYFAWDNREPGEMRVWLRTDGR
jgi:DUF1680 family protein